MSSVENDNVSSMELSEDLQVKTASKNKDVFHKDIKDLTVVDVYNIAAGIGREFEKLTDAFGGAVFSDVMPKMICVLEMLESFAAKPQNLSSDVVVLQSSLQKLQLEARSNTEKHKEELEMVDTAWKEETKQLLKSVDTLKEDNRRLTELLSENLEAPIDSTNNKDQQGSVASMLGESLEKQRDELREKNRLIEQQSTEVDALNSQIDRLTKLNVELRRKVSLMEKQASVLATANSDLEARCKEKDRQVKELQKRLMDLKVQESRTSEDSPVFTDTASCNTEWPGDPLLANKLVIDLSDPDRPRYTLHELQEVLNERNQLKLKCFVQEEELAYLKQGARRMRKRNEDQWEEIDDYELGDHEANQENATQSKPESGIKKLCDQIIMVATDTVSSKLHTDFTTKAQRKSTFASIFYRDVKSSPIPNQAPKASHTPRTVTFDLSTERSEEDDVIVTVGEVLAIDSQLSEEIIVTEM